MNRGTKFWDEFDPEICTWQQVVDAAEDAGAEYEGKAKGISIRRAFRSEALVRNLVPLLEGIPDNDGLGLLKGGLIILFQAVKRRSKTCDTILESLRTIPDVIADAQQKQRRFPKDVTLFSCTEKLYSALFEAIPVLIAILNRSIKEVGRSILRNEVLDVEKVLRPVVAARRALEQHVSHLATERDDQDSKLLRQTHVELDVLRRSEMNHYVGLNTNIMSNTQISERMENKLDKYLAEQARCHAYPEHVELRNEVRDRKQFHCLDCVQFVNAVYIINADSHRALQFCKGTEQSVLLGNISPATHSPKYGELYDTEQAPTVHALDEPILDPGQVLSGLCSDEEINSHVEDMYYTLRRHHDFSDKALAQAAYLTNMSRFRQWQGGSKSEILLVDGHAGSEGNGRTTPMSVFCAALIQSLRDINADSSHAVSANPLIVLYFFCGQHKDPDGHLPGPNGLMRSLIAQLILAWPEERRHDLQSIKLLSEVQQNPGSSSYEAPFLCKVFEELLCHLPPGIVVHGIIDGISHFETSIRGWSTDMMTIASSLERCPTRLSGAGENSSVLKMLLASAGKSTVVRDLIPREDQVSLRAGNFLAQPLPPQSLARRLSRQASSEEALLPTQAES